MQKVKLLIAVVVLAGIGGGLWAYWQYTARYPTTQDAYVEAHIVTVAAEVTGKVTAVHVAEDQFVKAGDPLFDLDDTVFQNAVAAAAAQVASVRDAAGSPAQQETAAAAAVDSAQAANDAAKAQLDRVQPLFDSGDVAQAALDQAQTAAAAAQSGLTGAEAALAQAKTAQITNRDALAAAQASLQTAQLNLSRSHVTAPVDGWVSNFKLREGTLVTAYAPLFSMVDSSDWWIAANFKETDLARIAPGQPVTVTVDLLPGQSMTGTVASIGRGSGATFALLPAENASGNWVKVTQRFPIRITLDQPPADLRAGASSTVTIDTTGDAG